MVDRHVRVERSGFFGEVGRAFLAIPIGILLFLGSFAVLFLTEGRTNEAKVAAASSVVSAESAGGQDGQFVSVTGELGTQDPVGDPDYLAAGDWLAVNRDVEMYAWTEDSRTEERKRAGGGTDRITYYEYSEQWVSKPDDSQRFDRPEGHQNPLMRIQSNQFASSQATIGAWSFNATEAQLPSPSPLSLAGAELKGEAAKGTVSGDFVYLGAGTAQAPRIGDLRISWEALPAGTRATAFAEGNGSGLVAHMHKGDTRMFRVVRGGRDEAISTLLAEFKMLGWVGRIAGFGMMWIGMMMVFAPLHEVLDILPFMGSMSRGLAMVATLPIALVLTTVTVVISMILHSVVALALIGVLLAGWIGWMIKNRKAQTA